MNTLIEQGKVFYWGTSEWSADQIMEAYFVAQKLSKHIDLFFSMNET